MDQALWEQTVDVAVSQEILANTPGDDSFTRDIARDALQGCPQTTSPANLSKRTDIVLQEGGS